MAEQWFERFAEAKTRLHRLEKAQRRQAQLQESINGQERLIGHLELQLSAEEEDVEQLTRMSLTNLFHTLLRNKDEQLELERQQALTAALKLQEARQALEGMNAERFALGDELAECRDAEHECGKLMAEKEAMLRNSPLASRLEEMESAITGQMLLVKELGEALRAGERVQATLEDASDSLEKAENWGNWDLWGGGGLISTHLKHGHVDEAKSAVGRVNQQMRNFQDELSDLDRSVSITIDISGLLKFGDYWFDGLITDWIVQKRIKQAQEQTLTAMQAIRGAVGKLQAEHKAAESALAGLRARRVAWIEQQQLQE